MIGLERSFNSPALELYSDKSVKQLEALMNYVKIFGCDMGAVLGNSKCKFLVMKKSKSVRNATVILPSERG